MVRKNRRSHFAFENLELRQLLTAVPFLPSEIISAPNLEGPYLLGVHDWNGDGLKDLLFESHDQSIQRYEQIEGTGQFQKELVLDGETTPTIADFNGDGALDLLSIDDETLQLRYGNAVRKYSEAVPIYQNSIGSLHGAFQPFDIDSDGDLDITFQMNHFDGYRYGGIVAIENLGDGLFADARSLVAFEGHVRNDPFFTTGDFDEDGDTDFATFMFDSRRDLRLTWHENSNGQFDEHFIVGGFRLHDLPSIHTAASLPGSNSTGFILGTFLGEESRTAVYSFDKNASEMAERTDLSVDDGVQDMFFVDLTGDGELDQILKHSDYFEWFQGQNGVFSDRGIFHEGPNRSSLLNFDDINGDGKVDLILSNREFDHLAVYEFEQSGTFSEEVLSSNLFSEVKHLTITDLNGDGVNDLIVGGESVDWLPGVEPGQFGAPQRLHNAKVREIVTEDFDLDGDTDLAISFKDSETTFFQNQNDGTFQAFRLGDRDTYLAVADVDGDGDFDLVSDGLSSFGVPTLSYYEFDSVRQEFRSRDVFADFSSVEEIQGAPDQSGNRPLILDIQVARLGDDGSVIIVNLDETTGGVGAVAFRLQGGEIGEPETLTWSDDFSAYANIFVADVNQDTKDDVVVNTLRSRGRTEWFDFQAGRVTAQEFDCKCRFDAVADLDRDGDIDFVRSNSEWRENGNLDQRRQWSIDQDSNWDVISIGDVNGDGAPDLAMAKDGFVAWVPNASSRFDFDQDSKFDSRDIDRLSSAIQDGRFDPVFDVNGNNEVDPDDLTTLLADRLFASPADVNLDGQFDSADLVKFFQAGKYGEQTDAVWSEGDLNGDGRFDSADLVVAFSMGDFVQD